jgi:molybdopterin converting factor small subunit
MLPLMHRMPTIRFEYYTRARDKTGISHERVTLPADVCVKSAIEWVRAKYSSLVPLIDHRSVLLAVNDTMTDFADATALKEGDTVAFVPPVSGG